MSESKQHKETALRIAKKLGTTYNPHAGPDIKGNRGTVEVETPDSVSEGPRQLQGHKGPVYIAGTNDKALKKALKVAQDTTIGVMDNKGKIIKRSTRKK